MKTISTWHNVSWLQLSFCIHLAGYYLFPKQHVLHLLTPIRVDAFNVCTNCCWSALKLCMACSSCLDIWTQSAESQWLNVWYKVDREVLFLTFNQLHDQLLVMWCQHISTQSPSIIKQFFFRGLIGLWLISHECKSY